MAVIYSEEAIENLDDIYSYIAVKRSNPETARRYLAELDNAIQQLDLFPFMGASREKWKAGLRALVHGNHVILYTYEAEDSSVVIQSVLDGRQDIESRYRDG